MNEEIKDWIVEIVVEYSRFAHPDIQDTARYVAANLKGRALGMNHLDPLGLIFVKISLEFIHSRRICAYQKAFDAEEVHYYKDSQGMLQRLRDQILNELIEFFRGEISKDLGWSHD